MVGDVVSDRSEVELSASLFIFLNFKGFKIFIRKDNCYFEN